MPEKGSLAFAVCSIVGRFVSKTWISTNPHLELRCHDWPTIWSEVPKRVQRSKVPRQGREIIPGVRQGKDFIHRVRQGREFIPEIAGQGGHNWSKTGQGVHTWSKTGQGLHA